MSLINMKTYARRSIYRKRPYKRRNLTGLKRLGIQRNKLRRIRLRQKLQKSQGTLVKYSFYGSVGGVDPQNQLPQQLLARKMHQNMAARYQCFEFTDSLIFDNFSQLSVQQGTVIPGQNNQHNETNVFEYRMKGVKLSVIKDDQRISKELPIIVIFKKYQDSNFLIQEHRNFVGLYLKAKYPLDSRGRARILNTAFWGAYNAKPNICYQGFICVPYDEVIAYTNPNNQGGQGYFRGESFTAMMKWTYYVRRKVKLGKGDVIVDMRQGYLNGDSDADDSSQGGQ